MDDSSTRDGTKTWGFRRSTIARREFIEEIGNLDLITLVPRRNMRQPRSRGRGRGRGKQSSETTSNAPKRARGGRRAVQSNLEPDPDPEDLITAPDLPCLPEKTTSDMQASDQAEDSDELTLKQLQERARRRHKSEEDSKVPAGTADLKAANANEDVQQLCDLQFSEENVSSLFDRMATCSAAITEPGCVQLDEEVEQDEQNDADESSVSDEECSDPNAIYCICQQKHNNRQVPHLRLVCCL